jgi:murein DD-endopeptidase MepM/ murein hydrolase activator NlpD
MSRRRSRFSLLSAILLLIAASCAPVDDLRRQIYRPDASGVGAPTGGRFHTVKKGDTLYEISRAYGVSVQALIRTNGIADPRDIPVGMRLRIPAGAGAAGGSSRSAKPSRPASGGKPAGAARPVASSVRFAWPVEKVDVYSRFGIRGNSKHDGIDLSAPRGTPIFAAADGEVIFSGWGPSGYGYIVMVKHDAAFITVYAHNNTNLVKKGDRVKRGGKLATVGTSGRATGPHVHFEIRRDRKPVDPERYLPRR